MLDFPKWHDDNGKLISCVEKIKVMHENLEELSQSLQDSYDDALLMDVSSSQIKDFLHLLVDTLTPSYER